MTNTRNAKTDEAAAWLGHVLNEYVTGDYDSDELVGLILTAVATNARDRHEATPVQQSFDVLSACAKLAACVQYETHTTVSEARRQGASWDYIGRALGITRQAAQQRFFDA